VPGWYYDNRPNEPPIEHLVRRKQKLSRGREIWPALWHSEGASPKDVLPPAKYLIANWINDHLFDQSDAHFHFHRKTNKFMIRIAPRNLLSAIWLQFAQAVMGNKSYRPCKTCGTWLEISKEDEGFSKNREFCSDACKSRDYRSRKEQARLLKEERLSVKEIAKTLDTKLTTIRIWLSK
jgi:hypothetical protein